MSKRLGGIIGCKYKTSSWYLNGFPDGSCLKKNLNASGPSEHPSVRGKKMWDHRLQKQNLFMAFKPVVDVVFTLKTVRTSIQSPLFLTSTLQGKEIEFPWSQANPK